MFKYVFSLILVAVFCLVFFFDIALTNEAIGILFVTGILGCLVLFLLFKFGLHYKIMGLNRFANAFYYSVFEYKKAQVSYYSVFEYKKAFRPDLYGQCKGAGRGRLCCKL